MKNNLIETREFDLPEFITVSIGNSKPSFYYRGNWWEVSDINTDYDVLLIYKEIIDCFMNDTITIKWIPYSSKCSE